VTRSPAAARRRCAVQQLRLYQDAGIDFGANYALDPKRLGIADDIGTFGLNFNGTLTTKYERQFAPGNTPWSCLGYFGFACVDPMPRWRHVAGVNWQLPWIKGGVGFTWRYVGHQQCEARTRCWLPRRVRPSAGPADPAYSYFDFNTNVTLVKGIDVRSTSRTSSTRIRR
jgi:hypothetical protein